jgi:hypothetical protein
VASYLKELNFGDSAAILKMLMQLPAKSQQKMTKLLLSYKWKIFEKRRSIFSSFLLESEQSFLDVFRNLGAERELNSRITPLREFVDVGFLKLRWLLV